MSFQLEFFDDNYFSYNQIELNDSARECVKCKKRKNLEDFRLALNATNTNYRRPECRDCEKEYNKSRTEISKSVTKPQIGASCDCCGRKDKPLVMDHCHKSNKVRGWICQSCNIGIGRLGDNMDGILKAVNYLKKYYENE